MKKEIEIRVYLVVSGKERLRREGGFRPSNR